MSNPKYRSVVYGVSAYWKRMLRQMTFLSFLLLFGVSLFHKVHKSRDDLANVASKHSNNSKEFKREQLNNTKLLDLIYERYKDDIKNVKDFKYFLQSYVRAHKRVPPANINHWFMYAQNEKCSTHHTSYSRIYKNLQLFIDKHQDCVSRGKCKPEDPVITEDQLTRASLLPHTIKVNIAPDGFKSSDDGFFGYFKSAIEPYQKYLGPVTLVLNTLDEPRVLKRKPQSREFKHIRYNTVTQLWDNVSNDITDLMLEVCDSYMTKAALEGHGFFLGPCSFSTTDELLPIFSGSSIGSCFADIIIPSHYYLHTLSAADWAIPSVNNPTDAVSTWQSKQSSLFWRGSTTGGGSIKGNRFMDFHRQRLVAKSQTLNVTGVEIDVRFTSVLQCDEAACGIQKETFKPIGPPVGMDESKKKKYLMDIDGNTFSQRILTFLRFTQSLVLKAFMFEDWITDRIVPGHHYVPVRMDLSDLDSQLEWVVQNDKKAVEIAVRGQKFAQEKLRRKDMECYMFLLLLEYQRLLAIN